jgi:very-short-patch-repair endonuclease
MQKSQPCGQLRRLLSFRHDHRANGVVLPTILTTPQSTNYDKSDEIGAKSYDVSFGRIYDVNSALNTFAGRKEPLLSPLAARANARRKARVAEYARNLKQSETRSERALWAAIRCSAPGVAFRRQVPIGGCFIGDFVANDLKLIVEVDGSAHAKRGAADRRRDVKLKRLGFTVLRLSATMVERELPEALRRIREAIAGLSSAP